MPRVLFTAHLVKHQPCAPTEVEGKTVAEALEAVFRQQPELRSYLLDDQGRVRQHVLIFVDDAPILDRKRMTDPLTSTSEVYVMQALSGG